MITLADYFMGRDKTHKKELTDEHLNNARVMVEKANSIISILSENNISFERNPKTGTIISSGWRPASVNARVKNAAPKSKHMLCQAVDIYDPEGEIDEWLVTNEAVLRSVGIHIEHPSATKGWSHWQCVPPKSGRFIFYP